MASPAISLKTKSSVSSYVDTSHSYKTGSASGSFRIKSLSDYDDVARIGGRHELSSRHSSASSRASGTSHVSKNSQQEYMIPTPIWNDMEKMKRKREQLVEQRLLANMREKKQKHQEKVKAAEALERKLPMDVLAREWFSNDKKSADIRVYLIENLMPTLILGLEKVLCEAEKRHLINNGDDDGNRFLLLRPKFNPINLLAQYLMRNNPKFSNFPEASPYARGLRSVAEDLKRQVFDLKNNKVAELKEEARIRREELEESEKRKIEEENKRKNLMRQQFKMWLLDDSQKLQLQLVQNGLFSYLEISAHLSTEPENVVSFSKKLEPTDETGITVDQEEFVDFLEDHMKDLPNQEFSNVLRHLNQCALAFRKTFEHEIWNTMFIKLFENLDTEVTGLVDRHRILHLLEKFWDQVKDSQTELRNPRKWPVIELEELDDLFPDSDDDEFTLEDDSIKVSTQEEEASDEKKTSEDSEDVSKLDESLEEAPQENQEISEEKDEKISEKGAENVVDESKTFENVTESAEILEKSEVLAEEKEEVDTALSERTLVTEVVKMSPEQSVKVEDQDEPIVTEVPPAADESPSVEEHKDAEDAENVLEQDDGQKEDIVPEEGVKPETEELTEMTDAQELPPKEGETEIKIEVEDEKEPEKTEKDVVDESADDKNIEDEKEQEKESAENDEPITKNLIEKADEGMVLATPTFTDDGASSAAVRIEFTKEKPQAYKERQVRKTTSYSVAPRKKSQQDEEKKFVDEMITTGEKNAPPSTILTQSGAQEEGTEEMLSTYFQGSSSHVVQNLGTDLDEENLFPYPVDVKARPASASRMSVTFAADPVILPDKPAHEFFSEFSSRSQSRMTSVFDENQLNQNRFVALLDTFLSEDATHHTVESLLNFIHLGYIETEEEKMERLARAHREALSAKHREMIENIFNKWDNDGQGYLDIETIEDILSRYKGGMEAGALKRGRLAVRQSRKQRFHDSKITRKEFHLYITTVCDAMAGGEEVFDGVIEYVTTTVERTYAESVRGEARRKWLGQIKSAAECSGATMAPVYRFIFQTLFKDAEAHGNQKKISAYIALLEKNLLHPSLGDLSLRYTACTPDNAPFMLGKAYYENMRGVSFYCIRRGKLVHVPRVHSHGRIYFWNPQRLSEEKEGSLVLLPLKDDEHRVFGLIGIDNLIDPADRSVFATHELNFYQGVAKAFASAFHHVDLKRKLLRIIDSAMSWIHSRAPLIVSITVYFVEPDPKSQSGHVLRKMMFTDNSTGVTQTYNKPPRLYRKDNLFRDYLFKCMETSETTTADAYGEYHTAYPLRGEQGRCQCLIDISMGKLRSLPKHEAQEMQRMLKLLQAANKEVLRESSGGKKTIILEAEERASDETRVEMLFDRLMLTDLRENVTKLDTNVFAELHNYKDPPPMIHNILKAVLILFHQDEEDYEQFQDWVKCKQLATTKLRQQIITFDPTAKGAVSEEAAERISGLLKGIAHGAVARHGSMPAQQIYNWAFVCLSLIEHTKKAGDNSGQPALTPTTSASTATTTDTQDTTNYL